MGKEAVIENRSIDRIHKRWPEAIVRKLNGYGHRDWPDQLVVLPACEPFFIEFKAPNEDLRPSQRFFMSKLTDLGVRIYVCDNAESALEACEAEARRRA